MMDRPRLVIFCKAPIPGDVKSRLIASFGIEGAAKIHEDLAARLIVQCLQSGLADTIDIELWCSPATDHDFYHQFDISRFLQQGDDLGERMLNAFMYAKTVTVLIGTDCPNLSTDYLRRSFDLLSSHDAVLGPAEDGGYGLIGLQRAEAGVFSDINWGTEDVCSDTCRHFNTLGMNWALMPLLWDVDRPEDVDRWRSFISVSDQSDS
jgi:hypothetical protein